MRLIFLFVYFYQQEFMWIVLIIAFIVTYIFIYLDCKKHLSKTKIVIIGILMLIFIIGLALFADVIHIIYQEQKQSNIILK